MAPCGRYLIFVPAQYTGEKEAGLLVFQDGQRALNPKGPLRVDQVMENLIAKKDIPVMIGLFITPGNFSEHYPDNLGTGNPNHRAEEYDALSDAYASMLIDELIPELKKTYKISDDVNSRVIGGTSSGAICAWTVAWERPDQFRKVISMIGSYTSIGYRAAKGNQPMVPGGDLSTSTPGLAAPPKPIRIFLQDGTNDLGQQRAERRDARRLVDEQPCSAAGTSRTSRCSRRSSMPTAPRISASSRARATSSTTSGATAGTRTTTAARLLPDILRWMFRDYPKGELGGRGCRGRIHLRDGEPHVRMRRTELIRRIRALKPPLLSPSSGVV